MFHRHTYVAFLLSILLVITACAQDDAVPLAPTSSVSSVRAAATHVVGRGSVVKTIDFEGQVVPIEETALYFATSGYVKAVYTRQGSSVSAGDLLAELEVGDLPNQIARAEATLGSARAALSQAEHVRKQEIAARELDLEMAKTRLASTEDANGYAITQAELALQLEEERLARLGALRAVYAADVARALADLEYAQAEPTQGAAEPRLARRNLATAQAEYDRATAYRLVHAREIAMQEIAVGQAKSELEQLRQGISPVHTLEVRRAEQALEGLAGNLDPPLGSAVDQAQLTLEHLRAQLARARVVSPVDGQVLYLSLRPGRMVEPFRAVIAVADRSEVEIGAELSPGQLRVLTEGQKASVSRSGAPQGVWNGTVRCLPYPYGTCGSAGESAVSVGSVRISLQGGTDDLKIGDPVKVSIVLEKRDDVLWLARAAIRSVQGREFVIVEEGRRQRRVEVQVGIEGADRTEILGGLEEGQVVVVP